MEHKRLVQKVAELRPFLALALGAVLLQAQAQPAPRLTILSARSSPTDLELTGRLPGFSAQSVGFLSYRQLAALPQTTFTLTGEADLSSKPRVTLRLAGVPLAELTRALGAQPDADLIEAFCTDRYRAHFPAAYIAAHHPVLILKIDGLPLSAWAARAGENDPGPYLIAQADFAPSFHLLGYTEALQFPTGVVQLRFARAAETFDRIAPLVAYQPDSPVDRGFRIAQGECLRCHYSGASGGTKSNISWQMLSTWAREQPTYFAGYIRNPRDAEPRAHMPAHPTYDAATLAALTAYFQTFAPAAAVKVRP